MASSVVDPPPEILSFHSDMSPQNHFKEKVSHQIQCWLRINCVRAFVREMTYPLESSNSSGGGNILLIKIKIKGHAGENLEMMTFRYLKIWVFDKIFLKLQHYLMLIFQWVSTLTYTVAMWFVFVLYDLIVFIVYWTTKYSEPCQTSKMEPLCK